MLVTSALALPRLALLLLLLFCAGPVLGARRAARQGRPKDAGRGHTDDAGEAEAEAAASLVAQVRQKIIVFETRTAAAAGGGFAGASWLGPLARAPVTLFIKMTPTHALATESLAGGTATASKVNADQRGQRSCYLTLSQRMRTCAPFRSAPTAGTAINNNNT